MTCSNKICRAYFCYNCLRNFSSSAKCSEHFQDLKDPCYGKDI
jgi:hypothetical protein